MKNISFILGLFLLIAGCKTQPKPSATPLKYTLTPFSPSQNFADASLKLSVDWLLRDAERGGRLILADSAHPGADSGYVVLAMGKQGAGEQPPPHDEHIADSPN